MEHQFIKGKWYRNPGNGEQSKNIYAKFESYDPEKYSWDYSEKLDKNQYSNNKGWWAFYTGKPKDYEEVPISEIAHLLPSNHPDLQQNSLGFLEIW